jgi:hypothetical protein
MVSTQEIWKMIEEYEIKRDLGLNDSLSLQYRSVEYLMQSSVSSIVGYTRP